MDLVRTKIGDNSREYERLLKRYIDDNFLTSEEKIHIDNSHDSAELFTTLQLKGPIIFHLLVKLVLEDMKKDICTCTSEYVTLHKN